MPNLRAIKDRFIVRRDVPVQTGRLVTPTHLLPRQRSGKVISAGPDAGVKVDETVVFSAMSGTVIEADDGDDVIVLRKSEVLGTLHG